MIVSEGGSGLQRRARGVMRGELSRTAPWRTGASAKTAILRPDSCRNVCSCGSYPLRWALLPSSLRRAEQAVRHA